LFAARGIGNPRAALIKAGISARSAHSILHERKAHIRFDHLERLCMLLHCTPNDLLQWHPDERHFVPDSHPLQALAPLPDADVAALHERLRHMPLEELRQLAGTIAEKKKE
jgi:DNA-binding Xre family transcriptional regulator